MKYEKPSMELKWLEAREVFMTASPGGVVNGGNGDVNSGWGTDNGDESDGF